MGETIKGLNRTHRCTEVNEALVGTEVTVMGWVNKRRDLGKLIFIAIRDRSGIIQAVIDGNNADPAIFAKAETIRSEYVLACKGIVRYRTEGNINEAMETGKLEIEVTELRILSESETPPFQIETGGQVKDDMRLKYRYLDLRRADMQKNMKLRHDTAQLIREFLSDEGFCEIDTPILTKSTPEGARDYIVPSRIYPGSFYALPQSPQLFKQLLMVSGMDRYFQIAKCFRDEDLRADRQPEFTQVDMELSFVNTDDVIEVNERLIQKIFKELLGVEVKAPFMRMTYAEAMERFGSDKPDLRFGMELVNLSDLAANCEFNVFKAAVENGGSVRGINAKGCGDFPRKKIDALVEFCKTYRAKGLAWIAISPEGEIKSQLTKFFDEVSLKALIDKMDGQNGDLLLICADKDEVVFDSLGALRCEIADKIGLLSKDDYKFLWVTEFPLLEWSEEDGRFYAKHHPFTAPMDEDLALLDADPRNARAKAYDIVLNGVEIGGGSIRIHQSDVQKKMLDILGFTEESAQAAFGFLLEAFKYGVPPHGGLAYGFDRLVMLLAGLDNIRDVIAFPKVKDASCPLTSAPDVVEQKQLDELGIKVAENV